MPESLIAYVESQPVYIEVTEGHITRGSEFTSSPVEKAAAKVSDALDSARDTVLNVARKMVGAIRAADQAMTPDEFELEFSLKFNAEGQAIIAKIGGEASLRVKMTYKHKPQE